MLREAFSHVNKTSAATVSAVGRSNNSHTLTMQAAELRVSDISPSDKLRFFKNVQKTSSCWLWNGARQPQGYGVFHIQGRLVRTHRVAWAIEFGDIPAGLFILHQCDNPPCCNPAHLFLGTCKDNAVDMARKGRGGAQQHPETLSRGDSHYARREPHRLARGKNHGRYTQPENSARGERIAQSKLTEKQVKEIREKLRSGKRGIVRRLACEYVVRPGTIAFIKSGQTWKHLI